ncbi:GNAT family N-acetyltransferase [Candidatus Acetothermia bacterium]|nr:GNAT family N-acetyltransferase [Candidatus Acetothermia bacterium]
MSTAYNLSTMEFQYRAAQPEDAPAIQRVAGESWHFTYKDIFTFEYITNFITRAYAVESLERQIQNPKHFFEVATTAKDEAVGFAHCGNRGTDAELFRLYLLPEYLRRGIGGTLIRRIEERLRAQGYSKYFCYVHERNEIGKAFYLKHGFVHVLERDNKDEKDWYMEKILSSNHGER